MFAVKNGITHKTNKNSGFYSAKMYNIVFTATKCHQSSGQYEYIITSFLNYLFYVP